MDDPAGQFQDAAMAIDGLSGRRLVVSRAAERVITLNTDPGSKGTPNA